MKNKVLKTIVSSLLIVVMLFTAVPITASAATSGKCGDNLTWSFNESTGELTIIGAGTMGNFEYGNRPWMDYLEGIKSVSIGNNVTNIGNYAFADCDSIESITIPDNIITIGDYTFADCDNLVNVTLGKGVKTIGRFAFYENGKLNSVTLGDNTTSIGYGAFSLCYNLKQITIPRKVTCIGGYAFHSCNNLESIEIPSSITLIDEGVFDCCDNLTDVYYSGTQEDWNEIEIRQVNDCLTHANIHCMSESEPPKTRLEDYSVGDIIEFGLYPQSEVTDESLISVFNSVSKSWVSYDYYMNGEKSDFMRYFDFQHEKEKYRAVIFLEYRPVATDKQDTGWQQYDNGYYTDTIYYFKFEPIKWRVLNPQTGLVVCNSIIDSQPYIRSNNTLFYQRIYDESYIRSWLNGKFWYTAFNANQQDMILDTEYEQSNYVYSNDTTTSSGVSAHYTLTDKIFLLSDKEIENENYGYISNSTRKLNETDYANCQGLGSGSEKWYSLRTSSKIQSSGAINNSIVYSDGACGYRTISQYTILGVVPAMTLNPTATLEVCDYNYTQSHVEQYFQSNNAKYESKYFGGKGIALDGTNGTPDMCIPGLSIGENMVPQGVAYYEAENQILISAYYKDAEQQSYPCYVFALDMETGDLVNEYKIIDSDSSTFMGHVGGIAVSDYNLYITGEDADICKVSLSQLEKKTGEIIIEDKVSISEWLGNANASYLSIDNGMLITGNFFCATDSKYDTPAKAANSVILAQNLSGNSAESEWNNFCSSAPFAIVKVPDSIEKIQGVCYRDEKFYISSSFGRRNTSTFYIADFDKTSGYTLKNIMSYAAPPMMEGITFVGNYIYTVFESAAAFYFKGLDGGKISLEPTDVVWKIDYKKFNSIYNLGEETYSFDNFGDSDSPDGHCFGMSVTSAGYYLNELDITDIGLNNSSELYTASETAKIKKPICKYQKKQGSYSRKAIVAGGTRYKYGYADIASDWEEVVRYVKSHKYDNTGELQIGFQKVSQGGHAINFLRYENVNGEDRIYAYDNNFPNTETYFCKGSDGKVYQKPYSTFSGAIDCIALRSVEKYFDLVEGFDLSRVIYGWAETIYVEGVTGYPMDLGGSGEYMMYEIPDGVDEVIIVPLTDNATFEYMNEDYQFGGINEETYGVFTLSTSESSNDESFVIENEQSSVDEVFVYDLDMTYKSYAWIETEIYVTGNVDYTVEYSSSNPSVAYVDEFGEVYAAGEGSAEITCTVTDEYGNVVTDTCEVKVSYAWWQWIIRILLLGFLWY